MIVHRRGRWPAALALVALAVLAGPAATADAHATLVASDPVDGAFLEQAPAQVRLQFDEPIDVRSGHAWVTAADGVPVALAVTVDADRRTVVATLPTLELGVVQVSYRVRDAGDLHAVGGSLALGIGEPAVALHTGAVPAPASVAEAAGRFLVFGGIGLLAGVGGLLWVLIPRHRDARLGALVRRRRGRLARVVRIGVAATTAGWLAEVVRTVAATEDGPLPGRLRQALFATPVGQNAIGSTVVAALVWRGAHQTRRRVANLERLVLVAALAMLASRSGHDGDAASYGAVAVRAGHLGAAGVWLGGLTVLVVVTYGAGRRVLRSGLAAFSPTALCAASIAAASGALMARRQLPSLDLATTTAYGQTLTAKMLAAAAVVGLGALHGRSGSGSADRAADDQNDGVDDRRAVGAHGRRAAPVRWLATAEVLAAVAAVWGAATLTATAPAAAATAAPPDVLPPRSTVASGDDLRVTVALARSGLGANVLVVRPMALASDAGAIAEVRATIGGAALGRSSDVAAEQEVAGTFTFPIDTVRAGDVALTLDITRAGRSPTRLTSRLFVVAPTARAEPLLPAIAVDGPATVLAAMALAIPGWRAVRRLRRRPGGGSGPSAHLAG